MKTEIQYEILRDYEDFEGKIEKGTRMTQSEWIDRCHLTLPNPCEVLPEWFMPVLVPIYTEDDMVLFAKYIIERNFPKEDTGYELYHKWLLLIK